MEHYHFDNLKPAIRASFENAVRLLEDAQYLLEYGRFPTAMALCILAQEEYAKTFMLHLVHTGAIPWSPDVLRALREHTCKQLVATIMDYLDAEWEQYLATLKLRVTAEFPPHIADALNIIRHEKVPRANASGWLWDDKSPCDKQARSVADGRLDQLKQNALYVGLGKTGQVSSDPMRVTEAEVNIEYEKTKRLGGIFHRSGEDIKLLETVEYSKVSDAFRMLFDLITAEEYGKRWSV